MKGKPDPTSQPVVHKLRGGEIVAWTTDINAYFGRNRHDNVLAACDKVRKAADTDFFAANFIEGEYLGRNNQTCRRYGVTRAGFPKMMKYIYNLADEAVLYLAAFDRKAEELRRREDPPELEPATIPDDPQALEPLEQVEAAPEPEQPKWEPAPVLDGNVLTFPFEFDGTSITVRGMLIDGDPWVVGNDAAMVLGYADPKDAVSRHCKGAVKRRLLTPGGAQEVSIIPESDIYRLIMRSKLPGAERFQDWVCSVVLPQIRKTGRYEPDGVRRYGCAEDLLADPHTLLKLAAGYAEKIQTLSSENERLEVQLSVVEPKAAALDRLGDRAGTMNLRSAAKALGFGPDFFKRRLEQLDYLFREDGRLVAYQKHIDAGLFVHKPVLLSHRDGTEYVVSQPLVTAKGLARLAVAFGVGVRAVLGQGVLGLRNDDGASDGEALH